MTPGPSYSGREHTHTDYDQGAPAATDPYRLATTVTSSVRVPNGSDLDIRKTVNGYAAKSGADPNTAGWVLRKPTTVTTWMGGGATPDIVHTTYYNLAGNTVEDRQRPRTAPAPTPLSPPTTPLPGRVAASTPIKDPSTSRREKIATLVREIRAMAEIGRASGIYHRI